MRCHFCCLCFPIPERIMFFSFLQLRQYPFYPGLSISRECLHNMRKAKSLGKKVISRQGNLKSQEEKIISQEINMQKVLLLKPDAVKSERRFVFAKQRTMTLIFITKRTELH